MEEKKIEIKQIDGIGRKPKDRQYRELTEEEIEHLFALFDKHNGNVSALIKDPESLFKSKNQVHHYKSLYGFEGKLGIFRAERAKKIIESLGAAQVKAIQRAMELLESRTVEVPSLMTGQIMKFQKNPEYKEILAAWEIIRTELGLPTRITKSEVKTDAMQVEQALNELNKFMENAKTEVTTPPSENQESEPVSI